MSIEKGKSIRRNLLITISLAVIFLFRLLPPIPTVTTSGMQVLGIFIGVLILWLTLSIDWPSILCIGALALVPELSIGGLLSVSIGSATFSFLMFTFLCTYTLSKTPFIRRCAVFFVTSRIAKRGPWMLSILFFASVLFVGAFTSPSVLFIVYLPIIEEIYAVLNLQKGDRFAAMLMGGLVVCCGVSSGMTPIAHVFPLMALDFYQSATGLAISYVSYMAFAIPVGLIVFALMLLVFRFVMRPDAGKVRGISLDALKADETPMDRREVSILVVFAAVVLLWVAPDLLAGVLPAFAATFKALGTAFPPLMGVVALSMMTVDGKPLLNVSEGLSKGVPWGALMMAGGTLALGSALSNADIGLMASLGDALAPLATGMAPLAMVTLFTAWAAIQTNLSSNMVTASVVTAIAVPICLMTAGHVSTAAVAAIIGMMASYAFAFPPAMPYVAIAGASGWTTVGTLGKYGCLIAAIAVLVAVLVGYPIAAALMPA